MRFIANNIFRMPVFAVLLGGLSLPLFAQSPPSSPATAVLVNLIVKPDADMAQLSKVMPEEVRATVRLYLDGKIQQWYSRGDGKGVVFVMNCATVEEARSLMDGLPLSKGNFANLDFMVLRPLMPLRVLLGEGLALGQPQGEKKQ